MALHYEQSLRIKFKKMIKLTCGDKSAYVRGNRLEVSPGDHYMMCGPDDIYDLSISYQDLATNKLIIEEEERKCTYEEALELVAVYGNVCGDVEKLKKEKPTIGQLKDAIKHAISKGVSSELCSKACLAIILGE